MSKWHEAAKAIAKFVDTADDWNWVSQKTPRTATISRALGLLIALCDTSDLAAPSRVSAGPIGEILFEWHTPHCYREAKIIPNDKIEWTEDRKCYDIRHGTGTLDGKIEWTTKEKR